MDYIERIGPYFFFYALAVVLLIVWIFYCSCCCCPSCCCVQKYEDYYVRNIAFSIAVVGFILIIGGCFAGFFFKDFLLEDINGVVCSFERLYFDIMEGQINIKTPKWPGLYKMEKKLSTLDTILTTIKNAKNNNLYIEENKWSSPNPPYIYLDYQNEIKNLMKLHDNTFVYLNDIGSDYSSEDESNYIGQINKEAYIGFNYYKELISLNTHVNSCPDTDLSSNLQDSISQLNSFKDSFSDFKGKVLDDIDDYQGYVEDYGDPGLIAILSVLLGFAILGIFSLFFYVLSKNQKSSKIVLHFVWNFSTFFTFLSLIIGGTFGIVSMASKDGIGFMKYIFGKENLDASNTDPKLIPAGDAQEYLNYCLYDTQNLATKFGLNDDKATGFLNNIYSSTLLIAENQKQLDSFYTLKSIENIKVSINNYKADLLLASSGLNPDVDNAFIQYNDNLKAKNYNAIITSNKIRCSSSQYEVLVPGQIQTQVNKQACLDINDWLIEISLLTDKFPLASSDPLDTIKAKFDDNIARANSMIKQLDAIQEKYKEGMENINDLSLKVIDDYGSLVTEFQSISSSESILSFLNCKFMENYINIVYETFNDLSDSSKYLCAILLCVSFVEIITIYCVMLTIFRFDNTNKKNIHTTSFISEKVKMNKDDETEKINKPTNEKEKKTEAKEKPSEPQKPSTESKEQIN